ncbi:TIGR04168 family protein [Prochlorococcus marinus]|uniref:TIGR04168 family protein n=1 Tax=Prochlorococcus marinus TaxID=1219 RepID=UPI002FBD9DBF
MAGDIHGSWLKEDHDLLMALKPDAILFVGDLGDGHIGNVKAIRRLDIPKALILGNHDRGKDLSGFHLKQQLDLLGDIDCSWRHCNWHNLQLSIVGGRPCSSGGGFYLSPQIKSVFGPITLHDSVCRIVSAAKQVPLENPLIILAHSGPTGLGSQASSICGRDWKLPPIDWGDQDLAIAINQIQKQRSLDLVVFGHMHHRLKRSKGFRETFFYDSIRDTCFLNAACVPRRGNDENGVALCHLSWVEFSNNKLIEASHRWFRSDASLAYKEELFVRKI